MKNIFFLTLLLFLLFFSLIAEAKKPSESIEPMGMGLAPGIYFTNFLFLYIGDRELAASMPAYRTALPPKVYECLFENNEAPEKCSYNDMQSFFEEQELDRGGRMNNKDWPGICQVGPRLIKLAPLKAQSSEQINEPLGRERADRLAQQLGITDDMLLTEDEFQCMTGQSGYPDTATKSIIRACSQDLSNSTGNPNGDIPLSSYGLFVNDVQNVRSLCSPEAPCLDFNKLFLPEPLTGELDSLFFVARECGFERKLNLLLRFTDLPRFAARASFCQEDWEPTCIVEADCQGKDKSCQESLVNPD